MIDQQTIDKIFNAADIVDVIQDFVHLKKRGANYIGLCPFHNEKTPSFSVSQTKGIFKCFGCGESGNSVSFIMKHEKISYPEALKYLAKKYHITIEEKQLTEEEKQQKTERESLLIITKFAQKYFTDNLFNTKEGIAIGLSYLKERGFSEQTIKKFNLGYALEANGAFTHHAKTKGYKIDLLVKTGLSIKGNNKYFDRFAGRVIFPIYNVAGNVIGFGGRILQNNKKTAKYLNSPESDIYHKSQVLFGLNLAKKSIIEKDNCILVEGYTDVISMHQSGVNNVISSSGTSLTTDQIKLIKRFTKNITIMYDGDTAGIKAILRGIDMIIPQDINVKIIKLPLGEDPDSFAQKTSQNKLLEFINNEAVDFIKFKTKLLIDETKNDPVSRSNAISDIIKSISLIPDNITRSIYINQCSKDLKINEEVIFTEVRKKILSRLKLQKPITENIKQPKTNKQTQFVTNNTNTKLKNYEKELIYYLIKFGNKKIKIKINNEIKETKVANFIINSILNDNLTLENTYYKQIFNEAHNLIKQNKDVTLNHFTQHQNIDISTQSINITNNLYELSKIHEKRGNKIIPENYLLSDKVSKAIISYKAEVVIITINKITKEIEKETNDEKLESLIKTLTKLNDLKIKLSKHLKRTIIN